MLTRLKSWLQINTLVKKCTVGICVITGVMLILAESLLVHSIYWELKPQLQHNYSVLISAVATKLSYILHQNSQYMLHFWEDDALVEDMTAWVEKRPGQEQTYTDMADKLVAESRGLGVDGAIVSSRSAFVVADGTELVVNEELRPYAEAVMQSEWFKSLPEILEGVAKQTEAGVIPECYSPVFSGEGLEDFLAFVLLREENGHRFYYIMVEPFSDFYNVFMDFVYADVEDFCLLGYDNQILYKNREESLLETMGDEEWGALFSNGQYAPAIVELEEKTFLGSWASWRPEQIKVAIGLEREDLLRPYSIFIEMITRFLFVFVFILVVFIAILLRRGLSPLKTLAAQMAEAKEKDYCISRHIRRRDEVGMLAESFYAMMEQIRQGMEQIQKQEKREKEIEYSLMVSQIDPHFIYNTLNTITYLAKLNQPKDIMIINNALIELLRSRLSTSKAQQFDRLENERRLMDTYITIQKYLCNNEINYTFSFDEDCADVQYPTNLLQPFVENAVLHGILLRRNEEKQLVPGEISIHIYRKEARLVTEISDNGAGMSEEEIEKYFVKSPEDAEKEAACTPQKRYSTHSHIGIFNIRKRMGYLYGGQFSIQAFRRESGGLRIQIQFPVERGGDD